MGIDKDLQEAFKSFRIKEKQVFVATVTAVDLDAKTASIKDIDDLEFFDVRLAAAEDDAKSVLIVPKVNSTVLVAMIGNDLNTLFVAKTNEVEKVIGSIETTSFKIDENGYQIKRGEQSLKTVLNDLIDEVNKIIVINGTTINVPAMVAIKERLNTILIA